MQRLTEDEVKNLTDGEVQMAYRRIWRDYCFGLLSDRKVPRENGLILEAELRKRGFKTNNWNSQLPRPCVS